MKRLWFSLCLLRLEQRNEVCEFRNDPRSLESFFKVYLLSCIVLCAAIFKGDCSYINRSPLKQLARSHYLFIIWSSQASSCSKAFNCATKAITSTFSMRNCRKMPFSIHSKIFLMMAQVDEILAIFVLGCCSSEK